ncbi:hypothetical protein M5K25_023845 [Dendrobium thyrsiflorum]|uniref:EXPERA domain-containing protein n=1 Tax=Dendrobium thyrsiflorum TaxID=117978 RepID=A0ABD0U0R6_DENTH
MGNIDDKMQPFLCMATITTFQDLLDRVAKFEKLNLSKSESHFDRPKKTKASGARKGEAGSAFFSRASMANQMIYNVDKGKLPMQYEEKPKQAYNPHPQPKLILGGNDKPRNFQGGGECPRQNMGTGDRTFPSLKDKMNKEYSFKRESVAKLFRQALKTGLELPECKRPEESKHTSDPNYCPYHRVVSHPIEDCYIFKDWLERKYRKGELTLSDNVLSHPRKESTKVVTSSSVPPDDERKDDKKPVQEGQWETAVSKKTTKMLKQLEGVPGVKWKYPIEPVLNLKGLPKVQASPSKQRPNQASSSKPKKPKFLKKKIKLKKPKEKKTITQKIIDSLDEYYQTVRQPIKLADFMSGLKVGETEENGDADSLPTEVCRVISVVSSMIVNEECVKEAVVESCMMVLPMDCSSEEDLYFPEEDESDPDLASQMEHVNLAAKLPKQEREKKQVGRKKASPTLPKAAIIPNERKHIPHLGSDTEEDDVTPAKSRGVRQPSAKRRKEIEYVNSDYDYESIFMNTVQCVFSRRIDSLSVSDSVLVVTRVPLQYFKEIIPREVHKVEELTTRYLPPLEKGIEPGNILYSVGIQGEENRDWCYKFVDSEELFPTMLPRFNTRGVQGMLRKQVNIPTSKRQLHEINTPKFLEEEEVVVVCCFQVILDGGCDGGGYGEGGRLEVEAVERKWLRLRGAWRFPKLSRTDRLLMCWWAFTGLTHIILEGYFAFVPDFFKKKTPFYLDELWKEYGKGDSRYVSRDSAIVAVEGFTAAIEGPACLLVVYAIASRKSYSYILQFAICLGQLYGCMIYFVTAYLDGDNFTTSPYYYWAYYIGANSFWIVIPTLIAIRSWKKIISVVELGNKKKTK